MLTFEQLQLGLNNLLYAFRAELLTVLSCDNFETSALSPQPDIRRIFIFAR